MRMKTEIQLYIEGRLVAVPGFLRALGLQAEAGHGYTEGRNAPVISVVGAGGKTSTIYALAKEYVDSRRYVAVTTTTHMMKEEEPWFLMEPSLEKAENIIRTYGHVWAGTPARDGRMGCLPDYFLEQLLSLRIPVLIEADGSRHLPVKAPGEREPVIHRRTTHVLSLYGMDGIGKQFSEVCFRPEAASTLVGKEPDDYITEKDVSILAMHQLGGKKGCPEGASYTVVLNKADTCGRLENALRVCKRLEDMGVQRILVTTHSGM